MKLIDLLVQELPKRGGWPEGVYLIEQNYDGRLFDGSDGSEPFLFTGEKFEMVDDWRQARVTREQYEAALQQPVWNGKGLPPVGCECEGKQFAQINWTKFRVVAIANNHVFGFWNDSVAVGLSPKMWEFRPIRSEAHKRRDAIISVIEQVYKQCPHYDAVPYAIYDAVARGDIPGIKLSD